MDSSSHNGSSYATDKENEQNQSRELLSEKLQLVIEDINVKRLQDTQVLADFKTFLDLQVKENLKIQHLQTSMCH